MDSNGSDQNLSTNDFIDNAQIEPEGSPFLPQNLVNLFIAPRKFFTSQIALGQTPYLLLVTWIYGIASAVDRIDKELMRLEYNRIRPGIGELMVSISESWIYFWIWALLIGAISGFFIWLIGGWWFGIRIKWSEEKNLDSQTARLIYIYSSFVHSGPSVLVLVISTFFYTNYLEAFSAESWYSVIFLILPFWSLVCSYKGVRSVFNVHLWKARLWFLILPGIIYLFAFGLIAYLLNMQVNL